MVMMEYVMSPRGILKAVQLLLVVIVLGMWFSLHKSWEDFISATIIMSFFSSLAILAQNLLLGPSRVTEVLMSGLLSFFFFVSAIVVLVNFQNPVGDACGAFAFFTSAAFGVDTFFAFKIETE